MHSSMIRWFLLITMLAGVTSLAHADRPNFLLILADDLTFRDIGCYGNPDIHTPHIDALAAQSLKFELAFSSAPTCAPTRMALYTGLHPVRNGGHPNHSAVYPWVKSLPHYLKEFGYDVGLLGKRHIRPANRFPFRFIGGKELGPDLKAVKPFIEQASGRPWCLVVASHQPHMPWDLGDTSAYDANALTIRPDLIDTPQTRQALTKYYAEITYFDQQVGAALKHLDQSGQADNTVVVLLSEQGSNLPFAKWTCYDNGLRAACLIRAPGLTQPGTSTRAMMQYVDLVPTVIELAGGKQAVEELAPADGFDGDSLVAVLNGTADQHHASVFGQATTRGIHEGSEAYGIRTVRTQRYRLIWNLEHDNAFSNLVSHSMGPLDVLQSWANHQDPAARLRAERYMHRPEFELYDLSQDPYELNNIADAPAHADTLALLKTQLQDWMHRQGDKGHATEMDAFNRMPGRKHKK